MDRGRRVWHRASGCFRSGQQSARRQGLRSGKMDGVRIRSRHGSARHDFVRYSRHPLLCAKRSALSPPVRMKFFVNWLGEFVDLPEDPEEIAALTGNKIKSTPREAKIDIRKTGVTISAIRECPFFSARRIDSVKVGPSPQWLRAKIESVGIRSINNIVDISNFVMLELGQPTHAFDADKLEGGINVRLARDGEKFLALDGKTYSLKPDNLVVANQERAVGIAGVMGGEETGVTESTRNVLLEAAYFLPASIRRTARNLNLPSDASYRFERGVDPQMILRASQRASELIREIAGGNPAKEIAAAGERPANPAGVSLDYNKCDQVLGIAIKSKTVDEILERFGLSKGEIRNQRKSETPTWEIPSYRRDLQRDVDLIEEVVRAYGVQKIAGTDRSRFTPSSMADRWYDLESALRNGLLTRGFAEVRTSKLIPRHSIASGDNAIKVRNPLSEDHVALRPSLLLGLLAVLDRNMRAGTEHVAIFELGRVFVPPTGKEERHLAILLWGNATGAPHWRTQTKRRLDFFDLKGAIASLPIKSLSFRRIENRNFALATEIRSEEQVIGVGGQLSALCTPQLKNRENLCSRACNYLTCLKARMGSLPAPSENRSHID